MVSLVSQIVVDASDAVFALSGITSETFDEGAQVVNVPVYDMIRFSPGSDQAVAVASGVNSMAVDGSGSVVALDSPSQETISIPDGPSDGEVVYNLVRVQPGKTTPLQPPLETGVSRFTVDGSGAVIALDSLSKGANGPLGQLTLFSPGSISPQPMAPQTTTLGSPVGSFSLDGSGSVVALIDPTTANTYTLVRFTPGSADPQEQILPVSSFVVDGAGEVVTLSNGKPERFQVNSNTPEPMDLCGFVSNIAVDDSGSVVALSGGQLWAFAPGSNVATLIAGAPSTTSSPGVTQFTVDHQGDVVALVNGVLEQFAGPSWKATPFVASTPVSDFVVDGTGSVYALDGGNIYFFPQGPTKGQEVTNSALSAGVFSNVVVDSSGSVVALTDTGDIWEISPGTTVVRLAAGRDATSTSLPGHALVDGLTISQIDVDASGSVIAIVNAGRLADGLEDSYLIRFAPGLTSATQMSTPAGLGLDTPSSFFVESSGGIVAIMGSPGANVTPRTGEIYACLVYFAPGATVGIAITDPDGNAITNINDYFTDGSGALFVLYNQLPMYNASGEVSGTDYSLLRIAPGTTEGLPITDSAGNGIENISNFVVDSAGSVVVLDGISGILYRVEPGMSSAQSINYGIGVASTIVMAFLIDGSGDVVALEKITYPHGSLSQDDTALIQYTPGSTTGTDVLDSVKTFALNAGSVIALDTESAGNLVYFAPGSRTPQPLPANSVNTVIVDQANGDIIAIENYNSTAGMGKLVSITNFDSSNQAVDQIDPNQVSSFLVDGNGIVIAADYHPAVLFVPAYYDLVSIAPMGTTGGFSAPNAFVPNLLELRLLPDGTMLVLSSAGSASGFPDYLYAYQLDGLYTNCSNFPYICDNLTSSFVVASGVENLQQFEGAEGSGQELTNNPPQPAWEVFAQVVEVIGALVVTYLTDGAGSPLVALAVAAGDAVVNETINHFLFNTPYGVGSIVVGAVEGAIGADGGILDAVGDLGDAVGGVVGDITDGLSDIGDTVGDLVGDVVDPDSTVGQIVGQALQTSFNGFTNELVNGGSLGQAVNAAFSSLESSVAQGLVNTTFVQDTISFLTDVAAQPLSTLDEGLSMVEQIAADGLSGSAFGQAAASFLVNAVQDGLTGQPLFQSGISFLDQLASTGLGDSPFAQESVGLVAKAVTSGVNSSLANSLVSFLGQTAADGLANSSLASSSFVQDSLSFLNETLAAGLGSGNLLQGGLSFVENAVADGLTASGVAQEVGSFLQQAGAVGVNFLDENSAELGSFLQDAAQAGADFVSSTLGVDAGAFLQQAAQDGTDFLNSSLVAGAGAFLDQAAQDGAGFLDSTGAGVVGAVLQQAAQAGEHRRQFHLRPGRWLIFESGGPGGRWLRQFQLRPGRGFLP